MLKKLSTRFLHASHHFLRLKKKDTRFFNCNILEHEQLPNFLHAWETLKDQLCWQCLISKNILRSSEAKNYPRECLSLIRYILVLFAPWWMINLQNIVPWFLLCTWTKTDLRDNYIAFLSGSFLSCALSDSKLSCWCDVMWCKLF